MTTAGAENGATKPNSFRTGPDDRGHFGKYGGRYVAETLMPLILSVEKAWHEAREDQKFLDELDDLLEHYVGRPSPLYFAERLTEHLGGAKIYMKRDELNHTGAHKINHAIGQVLLAKRMGKTRIIAETGAGQHGVATATVAARFGLPCTVFMGAKDMERQKPNVFRMRLLGADVRPCHSGSATLKDAMNEALRDWVANVDDTFYVIGTVAGPHPYPEMVRAFQSVIGREARAQIMEREGRLPDSLWPVSGAAPMLWDCSMPFSMIRMWPPMPLKRRAKALKPANMRQPLQAEPPAFCTATKPICYKMTTARSSKPIPFRRVSIIPALAPNMRGWRIWAG